MEKIPFINYPGSIATFISGIIHSNPSFFLLSYQFISIATTIILSVIVLLNFLKTENSKSLFLKVLTAPVLFIIVSVISIFILRIPNLVLNEQNIDESQWIANAGTWLNGAVIWKDVSGFTGGPLLYVPLSIMFYFGDGLNYASIRMFALIFCVIPSLIFTWLIFKNLFDNKYASLLILPLILFFSFSNSRDFIAYNSELIPMLFSAISIYLFISWQIKNSTVKLLLLGFVLGCFPYAKLQAVPIALSIVVCTIIDLMISKDKTTKQKLFSSLVFISGGILPSVFLLVYLIQNEVLLNFWNDYIIQNLSYTQTGLAYHIDGFSKLFIPIIIAKETPELSGLFCSVGVLLIISSVFIYRRKNEIAKVEKVRVAYFIFILMTSYLCVSLPGGYFYHYENLLIIPFIIFAGTIIGLALPFLLERFSKKIILLSLLTIIISTPLFVSLYIGNSGINFIREGGNYEISAVAKEISNYSIPNEKLAIWGWNHKFYVETGLTQGTWRANSFYEATYALNNDNTYLEIYISDLKKNQPVIFLDASQPRFIGFKNQEGLSHENFTMLNDYINKNYTLVSEINQKKIYVLNERLMRMGLL